MKFKTLLLVGLAMVGVLATSCKKVEAPVQVDENGSTYAGINLTFGVDAFRAPGDPEDKDFNHIGEWKGNDAFDRIDIYIVDRTKNVVSSGEYLLEDFNQEVTGDDVKLTPKRAIKTTPGMKDVFVLINAPTDIRYKLATVNKEEFEKVWKEAVALEIAKIAKVDQNKDHIMMSNSVNVQLDVKDGITAAKALAGDENQAVVPVKRAAARVVVTTTSETYEVKREGSGVLLGTIKKISYAVAQGEKKLFIQQLVENNVIKTPAYEIGANWDKNWNWSEILSNNIYTQMSENYDYSDLSAHKFDSNPRMVSKKQGELNPEKIGAIADPVFILEASHKRKTAADETAANYTGGFRRGNTPYVLVRALFVPEQGAFAENNTKTAEGQDFWMGTTTGKLYSSKENVQDPTKGGLKGQKSRKYEKGKVLYWAFVNPDNKLKTLDAPAFRNNVYHINITAFKEIGFNWNPIFPEDPNTPDPKNPDPKPKDPDEDPNVPFDPSDPNSPTDTYMSVTVNVLKWNVHSYDIDLGL